MNNKLIQPKSPWLHIASVSISDLTNYLWSLQRDNTNTVIRLIRSQNMCCDRDMFNEVSAAYQFPYYFGCNWNAFNECITDLVWLPADSYITAIADYDYLINKWPDGAKYLIDSLLYAAEEWSKPINQGEKWDRPAKSFHIILHSSSDIISSFLQKHGIETTDLAIVTT